MLAKLRAAAPKPKKTRGTGATEVELNELPFGNCRHLSWARTSEVCAVEKGAIPIQKAEPGPYPLVTTGEQRGSHVDYQFDSPAAIVPLVSSTGHGHASLKRLHYQEGKFALGNILCAITPLDHELLSARFLYEYLSAFKEELLVSRMVGTANVSLTIKKVCEVPIPIVNRSVQERVYRLMKLCDELETQNTRRGEVRTAASRSALAHVTSSTTRSELERSWQRVNDHFDSLYSVPETLGDLRQTILQLAVQGKLVPQDPEDEPAEVLLEQLEASGGNPNVRRSVPLNVPRPDFLAEESLPVSWSIASTARLLHLGAINDLKDGNHGANHPKVAEFTAEGLPFITAAQVNETGGIDYDSAYKVSGDVLARLRVGFAKPNDVIYTHKGSVGRVAICERDCILTPQTTYYRVNSRIFDNRYLRIFLLSRAFRRQVDNVKGQTTRDFVSIKAQYNFYLHVPPLAEQKRIVAKVDGLLAELDGIATQLESRGQTTQELLEAAIHGVLEGV
ncbi:restriction endonuclease subunit S [Aeoliella sp. ICT_H6.2]|uniref:Restriction endonuclease subunit S n=1 Tax=Aeoliella straminimaris TaxID=2954799 RepID=A0A9X2F7Z1_9BACT|nr:restriction endonuclease subunit S [Aeoliella straminimaris]MCO6043313.1 restriction endonuclease subunit S [Aeoliella straminimaris]